MNWIGIAVSSQHFELVMCELLSHFHTAMDPAFEVHNAWGLDSLVNLLYLSPMAYDCLATVNPAMYDLIGPVEMLPPGCDLLMGDQTARTTPLVVFKPTFVSYDELMDLSHTADQG